MTQRDAEATRQRILEAATHEFALHGLAGARIDRISEAAHANKRAIYEHFGGKDSLFDTVIEATLDDLHHRVPFDPTDLQGFAAALFDYLDANPLALRLDAWRRLERPEPSEKERSYMTSKVTALDAASDGYGIHGAYDGADVLTILMAVATAWHASPSALRDLTRPDRDHLRRLIAGTTATLERSATHSPRRPQ